MKPHQIAGGLLGVAIGDALGIPHEFDQRDVLASNPVTGMDGHKAHNQPAGTWSDDTSLTCCLVESLLTQPAPGLLDREDLAERFQQWYEDGYWTARGDVFDIGVSTRAAILAMAAGVDDELDLPLDKLPQGNDSLMRVLPVAMAWFRAGRLEVWDACEAVSGLTHKHPVCHLAAFIYVEMARNLLHGLSPQDAYKAMVPAVNFFLDTGGMVSAGVQRQFDRILHGDIGALPVDQIYSDGHVVHSLEAALWALLTGRGFADTVLKAVNLGDDADTVGSLTGGLAGVAYGADAIPGEWLATLARIDDLWALAGRFQRMLAGVAASH